MGRTDLYDKLKDFEAFRLEDLPESVRKVPYLHQKLAYLESTGRLQRIRRGAYLVLPSGERNRPPSAADPFIVASVLARPYAVSFHSALAIRGLAEAASRRIFIQTPKPLRPVEFGGAEFVGVRSKDLFGVETVYRSATAVQVTDTERTLLDCLRYPRYAGGLDEFLRSIEGVAPLDLLSTILDGSLERGEPPSRLAFRAKFEDRRPEFDQLVSHGLIQITAAGGAYLTVMGLAFCPHPKADEELHRVKKLYALLRERYKVDPNRVYDVTELASALELKPRLVARAAQVFASLKLGSPPMTYQGGWPTQIHAQEPILDFRDLDQYLAAKLPHYQPPPSLSLDKRSLAFVRFDRLLEHLARFGEKFLYAKAGFLVTLFRNAWQPPADAMRELVRHVSDKKYYFPAGQKTGAGKLIREWNLIVPAHLHARYVAATGQPTGGTSASV